RFPDNRVHTVGANDEVGILDSSIGELQRYLVAQVVYFLQFLVEGENPGWNRFGQELLEIAAMYRQISRTILSQRVIAQRNLGTDFSGHAVTAIPKIRMAGCIVQFVFDPNLA